MEDKIKDHFRDIYYELKAVIIDGENGRFDNVCIATLERATQKLCDLEDFVLEQINNK